MNRNQRKSNAIKTLADESEFFRIPSNRTHSGRQLIPTASRPLVGGYTKLQRKAKGHTFSKKNITVSYVNHRNRKVTKVLIVYENWRVGLHDYIKLNPSRLKDY